MRIALTSAEDRRTHDKYRLDTAGNHFYLVDRVMQKLRRNPEVKTLDLDAFDLSKCCRPDGVRDFGHIESKLLNFEPDVIVHNSWRVKRYLDDICWFFEDYRTMVRERQKAMEKIAQAYLDGD